MYARVIVNSSDRQTAERSKNLAVTVAEFVDLESIAALREQVDAIYRSVDHKVFSERWGEDDWNEYVANYAGIEQSVEFLSLRGTLRKFQDHSGVDCVYLCYVDTDAEGVKYLVYLTDGAYEGACPPGCIDVIDEVALDAFASPMRGPSSFITDSEEYGHLISACAPVWYDDELIAYTLVDVSIDALRQEQTLTVLKLYGYLAVTAALICVVAVFVIKSTLISPIKALSEASHRFAEDRTGSEEVFANLHIKTHDELQELAESMKNMEVQINSNIRELTEMNRRLIASQNMASEMSELANKDALTGVRNKMAYERYVERMDAQLKSEPAPEFGVAMIDLNSLKQINDTLGHTTGDAAIVGLSKIICRQFAHSPVFRIGGDEFAVILQNEDYANASELVAQFRRSMDEILADLSRQAEGIVTAALGYAAFDRAVDTCYDDVFDRADNEMYRNKSEMKGGNDH